MSKNFSQYGNTLSATLALATVSGIPYTLGTAFCGIAQLTKDANVANEFDINGVYKLPKSGIAIVMGTKYDWSIAGGNLVAAGAGDFEVGPAIQAQDAGDDDAYILVNGLPRAFN